MNPQSKLAQLVLKAGDDLAVQLKAAGARSLCILIAASDNIDYGLGTPVASVSVREADTPEAAGPVIVTTALALNDFVQDLHRHGVDVKALFTAAETVYHEEEKHD